MATITCIEDLRKLAERRVPRMFYDYADSGSYTEGTYRANETDFDKIKLRQRVAVDMDNRTTKTTMIGHDVSMPVALAPTGLTGMQHADGEILAAKACREVRRAVHLVDHVDLLHRGRERKHNETVLVPALRHARPRFSPNLIGRAKAAGCSALVLTLDLQILGQRHKDVKNGLSAPPKADLANIINLAFKPALVPGHARHPAAHLPQHRRPRQGRRATCPRWPAGPQNSSTRSSTGNP
jgi:L-lactate dehydrogenase (cytochrome)